MQFSQFFLQCASRKDFKFRKCDSITFGKEERMINEIGDEVADFGIHSCCSTNSFTKTKDFCVFDFLGIYVGTELVIMSGDRWSFKEIFLK